MSVAHPGISRAHHDGSPHHVSDPHPDLGDTVGVWVRTPADVGTVHCLQVHDGEPRYAEATVDRREETGAVWWRADVTARNPITRYRFLLDGGTARHRWLTGQGEVDHDPLDWSDFRLSAHPAPPRWASDAVVYQIFPDRFARSDRSPQPPGWARPAGWDEPVLTSGPDVATQLYGGDLLGLRQRLDHLVDLGVTAVYLNPVFPAESNHRYNATTFDHVDPLLGGDEAFAALSGALHERGMRLIGDLTPNHCGDTHEWFRTAQADAGSAEAGFFNWIDHPHAYEDWLGFSTLPVFDHRSDELAWRLYSGPDSVVARWLRPPFSLDGWRMDVAQMTAISGAVDRNLQVAQAMRRALSTTEPDAVLIAEHPFDAAHLLMGDAYHGTMNYAGFARPVWSWLGMDREVEFLGLPVPIPPTTGVQAARTMTDVRASVPWAATTCNFNQLGSHDTARVRTVMGSAARQVAAAGLLMTHPGMPVVYAGDEIGLQGRNALDNREPMPWDDRGRWDQRLHAAYRELIALRHAHPALRRGGLRWAHVGDDVLAFCRETAGERLLVAVSRGAAGPVQLSVAGLGSRGATGVHAAGDLQADGGVVILPAVEDATIRVWAL